MSWMPSIGMRPVSGGVPAAIIAPTFSKKSPQLVWATGVTSSLIAGYCWVNLAA